jgi:hypothetical protein
VRRPVPADLAVVALTTLAVFTFWASSDGGYEEVFWYPAAILLLVLGAVCVWAAPGRRPDTLSWIALGSFAAYTAWSFLTILWAGDRGLALTGANRTLAYLVVFVVVLSRRWTSRDAFGFAAVWAALIVVCGLTNFLLAALRSHPLTSFDGGRLVVPIGYANANAALFVLAAWPLLVAAQRRAAPALLRGLALGGAGVAVELAIAAQSKGAVLATTATTVLVLAVFRDRVRLFLTIVAVAIAVAAVHGPLLSVYTNLDHGEDPRRVIERGLAAIAASAIFLVAAGALAPWIGRLLGERRSLVTARVVAAVCVLALLAGGVGAIAKYGSPLSLASRGWHAFKHPATTSASSSHFASSAGNHRYDFWRVAWDQFLASPVQGKGADNFAVDYLQHRRSVEEPLYPHSIEARVFGGTGAVGALLFGLFLVAAAAICFRSARRRREAAVGIAALAMLTYWFFHGSVDWLWEFPAVTAPVLAVVAVTASAHEAESRDRQAGGGLGWRWVPIWGAVALAALLLVPAWLAARETALAVGTWRSKPTSAYAQLDNAAGLNRLSDEPYVLAGTIAERKRDWPRAAHYFTLALRRVPSNWYSQLELAVARDKDGSRASAIGPLLVAKRLDPSEEIVGNVLTEIRAGRPVDVGSLDQAMVGRTDVPKGR